MAREPITHELKCAQPFFELIWGGEKRFEIRKDDRDFQADDTVVLREFDGAEYSHRHCVFEIAYVLRDYPALRKGYCAFGFKPTLEHSPTQFDALEAIGFHLYAMAYRHGFADAKWDRDTPYDHERLMADLDSDCIRDGWYEGSQHDFLAKVEQVLSGATRPSLAATDLEVTPASLRKARDMRAWQDDLAREHEERLRLLRLQLCGYTSEMVGAIAGTNALNRVLALRIGVAELLANAAFIYGSLARDEGETFSIAQFGQQALVAAEAHKTFLSAAEAARNDAATVD